VAVVGTFILLKILDVTMGLRVKEDEEEMGLDVSQHGERGYDFEEGGAIPVYQSVAETAPMPQAQPRAESAGSGA
jgi:hypothetical protein